MPTWFDDGLVGFCWSVIFSATATPELAREESQAGEE
jgi:hypothetical protein